MIMFIKHWKRLASYYVLNQIINIKTLVLHDDIGIVNGGT